MQPRHEAYGWACIYGAAAGLAIAAGGDAAAAGDAAWAALFTGYGIALLPVFYALQWRALAG